MWLLLDKNASVSLAIGTTTNDQRLTTSNKWIYQLHETNSILNTHKPSLEGRFDIFLSFISRCQKTIETGVSIGACPACGDGFNLDARGQQPNAFFLQGLAPAHTDS